MDKVYVFGHRNPDTDSVTAAVSLAYLKKKLGLNAIPAVLSTITRETEYALKYFNIPEPMFLNDIKLKVKDIDYSNQDPASWTVHNHILWALQIAVIAKNTNNEEMMDIDEILNILVFI